MPFRLLVLELVLVIVSAFGGFAVYCCWRVLKRGVNGRSLPILRLARPTICVLCLCALVATFKAGAKHRAPLCAQLVQEIEYVGPEEDEFDDVAAITSIVVTNGIDLVLHRPVVESTDVVEVAVCASTNLVSDTWFVFTNAIFTVNATDIPLHIPLEQLGDNMISKSCFFCFVEAGDMDGDGLDNWYELHVTGTDPRLADSDGDGFGDCAELALGLNPLVNDAPSNDFAVTLPNLPHSFKAWEIMSGPFDFTGSQALSNIVMRTFRVDRTSPWQQLFLVADVNYDESRYWSGCYTGWTSTDVEIRYGVNDGSIVNLAPQGNDCSFWRIPLGTNVVTNITVCIAATGPLPCLSSSLHLLNWTPPVTFTTNEQVAIYGEDLASPVVAVARDPETSAFLLRAHVDYDDIVFFYGSSWTYGLYDYMDWQDELLLPPVPGLLVKDIDLDTGDVTFRTDDPLLVELPAVGTNGPVRVCCYEVTVEGMSVSSGPRASQFASPYPLSSSSARMAYHTAWTDASPGIGSVEVRVRPENEHVGLSLDESTVRSRRLLAASASPTNPTPPGILTTTLPVQGWIWIDPIQGPDFHYPVNSDNWPQEAWDEDDDDCRGSSSDDCECNGGDGHSLCSFRLGIPLGHPSPDSLSGYVWTSIEQPTAISPSVFNILGTADVSSTTNAAGAFTVVCSANGGKTVSVTNITYGVAITVFNASGRFEYVWNVWNPDGALDRIRARRMTILGSITEDVVYDFNDTMGYMDALPPENRVCDVDPSEQTIQTDELRGVRRGKWKWRMDPGTPDFVTDVHDETSLNGETVSSVSSEYEKIGVGSFARCRLTHRSGFDIEGPLDEVKTYWCDGTSIHRHARLRSLRSNREPWRFHDYDALGRETTRLEQLDGSPFPDGLTSDFMSAFTGRVAAPSATAAGAGGAVGDGAVTLPAGCSAKATATFYAPATGDSDDRNDVDLPRRRDVYVLRAGRDPILIGTETWLYTRSTDSAGVPLRTCVHSVGIGSILRSETTVEYPEGDYAVPKELRGRAVSSLDFDGVLTTHVLERGTWDPATRTFAASPSGDFLRTTTRRSRDGVFAKTYSVAVENALRHLEVYRAELLTADDATIDWSASSYDDVDRLRSTVYPDGTFETNAYSCCRLLWRQDRQGRKVLRSARTGTDDLYYAEEDVWLAEIENGKLKIKNGGDNTNGFRVTQHFFDGLGRETDTVVGISYVPGSSTSPSSTLHSTLCTLHSEYPYLGGGYSIHVDERGKTTETETRRLEDREERMEIVSTNDVVLSETTTTTYRNGRTEVSRWWHVPSRLWSEWPSTLEKRFTDYAADGRRIDTLVTESSDCGTVTNSVTTYDLLGRVVSVSTPLSDVTNTYDGSTSRILSAVDAKSGVTTMYLYDELGEQIGASVNGVANTSVTTYEEISNAVWKIVTDSVVGTSTNSRTITRTRLTDLSDACRRHTVTITGTTGVSPVGGVRTESLVSYDPDTGIETETTTSDLTGRRVVESRHGVDLILANASGTTTNHYDALARRVRVEKGDAVQESAYDATGALVETRTLTATNTLVETNVYDMLGRRVETVNALGQSTYTAYDALGNVVAEWGATYPVQYEYDTAGRRTALATTRDGVTWDETRWTYDSTTGLCLRKTYADGSYLTYSHTPDGLLLRTTYASGRWMENMYDARRRLVGVRYDDGNDVSYERDVFGRETVLSNAVASYAYARECGGIATNEVSTIDGITRMLRRGVDGQGRLNGLAIPFSGYLQAYDYTEDGKIRSISNAFAVVTYAYTSDGMDAGCSAVLPNGMNIERILTRDPSRRALVTDVTTTVNGNAVESFGYAYDANGRPVVRNADTFCYNARSEVTSATISGMHSAYGYDEIGNSTNWTANCLNQYTHCTYDADGNMTHCGPWSYAYDSMNRLASVSSNDVLFVTNSYDAKSRRVRKVTPEATTTFFYDDWNLVEEHIAYTNGTISTVHYYWGKDLSGTFQEASGVGGLLFLTIDGTIYIPCYDNNGNITRYLDANSSSVADYTYDAFGNTISQTGMLAFFFRHLFSSKYFDVETSLYYYGHRFYSPWLLKWLTRDPIGENGGKNLYLLCANNNINRYDKDGCAYFALRPLSGVPWLGLASHNIVDDILNTEIAHEHLFFEDGKEPNNYGLHEDVGNDGKQIFHSEHPSRYKHFERGYDDCVMRMAVANVKPKPYSLLGSLKTSKYNCQDYCSDLRREYFRLLYDSSVRKKCCVGKKK